MSDIGSGQLTCDQVGAAPCPHLIGDVTGVLAVALSIQCLHQVSGVVPLVTELSDGEEAGSQLPLVPEQAGRVSLQEATGEAECSAQSLPNLREGGFHHRRNCEETAEVMLPRLKTWGVWRRLVVELMFPVQSLWTHQEIWVLAQYYGRDY